MASIPPRPFAFPAYSRGGGLGSSFKKKFAAAEEQIKEHMRQLNETKELLNAQIDIDKRIFAQFVGDVAAASWGKVGSTQSGDVKDGAGTEMRIAVGSKRRCRDETAEPPLLLLA
jgi:hypothetical protein